MLSVRHSIVLARKVDFRWWFEGRIPAQEPAESVTDPGPRARHGIDTIFFTSLVGGPKVPQSLDTLLWRATSGSGKEVANS